MRKKKTGVILVALFLLVLFVLISSKFFPLFSLLFNQKITLKKTDGNINMLLLGIGGGKHEGPNLTDTIIFANIDPEQNKAVLVSIPRDLWIEDLKGRINIAYAKGGLDLSKDVVSKVVGLSIDYVFRIDFDGFGKAIDLLGGVDVNVPSVLDDYAYPIPGKENDPCGHKEDDLKTLATASSHLESFPCRYSYVHFDKGLQHMDGEKALRFVRSRHSTGDEGTDFARSKRQGELIKAIKDKVFSVKTLLNPEKIVSLYSVVKDSIDTNIKEDELDDFIHLTTKMKDANIQDAVLDYGDEEKNRPGLLTHPAILEIYNNEWVLIPRIGNNNFEEIQKYVDCEIKTGNCPISKDFKLLQTFLNRILPFQQSFQA